ncbi:hypothetical protein LBMAG38_25890 [Chloroflexota bacterium]|nr:hypothetical protein LBMAG38_25890 [Chloroflexota bacterium]
MGDTPLISASIPAALYRGIVDLENAKVDMLRKIPEKKGAAAV